MPAPGNRQTLPCRIWFRTTVSGQCNILEIVTNKINSRLVVAHAGSWCGEMGFKQGEVRHHIMHEGRGFRV